MDLILSWFITEGTLDVGRLFAVLIAGIISILLVVLGRLVARSERGRLILAGQDAVFNFVTTFVVRAEEMLRHGDFDSDDDLADRADVAGHDIRMQWVFERMKEVHARHFSWLNVSDEEILALIARGVKHFDSFRDDQYAHSQPPILG
jgi:hypothetical protein